MPHFLTLRGGQALSEFRLEKLNSRLNEIDRSARISEAVHLHFAESDSALDARRQQVLQRLLEYGDASGKAAPKGELLLVVPRIGTISPWSSKATDILHQCGLGAVTRVERGIAYTLTGAGGNSRARIAALLHDRMTESVLNGAEEAQALFRHVEPRPLGRVPLSRDGVAALDRANVEMGLALSADEIDYP